MSSGKYILKIGCALATALFAAASASLAGETNASSRQLLLVQAESPSVFHGVGKITNLVPAAGLITIDHEDIAGLMSAMEMQFEARPDTLLNGLKIGDKIAFAVSGKTWIISEIQKTAP
jgi:Cu/Ag efflux protein CusF